MWHRIILAAIVAVFSFLGTYISNYLSVSTDYRKAINSLNAARRDEDVKNSLEEFIKGVEELKSQVNIILKNLSGKIHGILKRIAGKNFEAKAKGGSPQNEGQGNGETEKKDT